MLMELLLRSAHERGGRCLRIGLISQARIRTTICGCCSYRIISLGLEGLWVRVRNTCMHVLLLIFLLYRNLTKFFMNTTKLLATFFI